MTATSPPAPEGRSSSIEDGVWRRGLDWVEGNLGQFSLPPLAGEPDIFRLKVLGELARAADLLCRRGDDLPQGVRARAASLLQFAWDGFGRGEVFARFLRARPYPVLGTMYSIFEGHGLVHEPTRDLLAALGAPGALSARTVSSQRPSGAALVAQYGADGVVVLCLGLALAWRVMGLPCPWSLERLLPETLLARRLEAPTLSNPDTYSVTHTVFFMTDFGRRPEGLALEYREHLRQHGPRWMEAHRQGGNLDLYAELGLVLSCIGVTDVDGAVESVLRGSQAADGGIPGPLERARARSAGVEDPERRRFLEHYHTTLAGLMASFAATVGLRRTPPPVPAPATA